MCSVEKNHISVRDKLLVIDDDITTRLLIKEIMSDTEKTVIETGCGSEAIDLFNKYYAEIFIVILDILLPVHDGWTLLQKFRNIDPRVPIIVVSAILPRELAIKCEMEGVPVYLSKPFRVNELRKIIESYTI
jgi:CheY-like chemotaxis protein